LLDDNIKFIYSAIQLLLRAFWMVGYWIREPYLYVRVWESAGV
jgi:hypothetical protein